MDSLHVLKCNSDAYIRGAVTFSRLVQMYPGKKKNTHTYTYTHTYVHTYIHTYIHTYTGSSECRLFHNNNNNYNVHILEDI
jgi:hypothetical protein